MSEYLGQSIPKLGFGLMRLPTLPDSEAYDMPQVKAMVDSFMQNGFTYFDTAYGYGGGASERAAKEALVDRYPRDSFYLATKLPAWAGPKTKEEAEKMLEVSLERTGAGYFDFYLLHNLGGDRTHYFDDYDLWNFVQRKKKEGILRHVGFSWHDGADALDKVLTAHPEMEFVQLQINYVDWESPSVQSRACYEVARKHGKPVIIMEPVKGGNLANPPASVATLLQNAAPSASPSSWAIRFAASLPGVITVLSGMSNMAQMQDNISYMKDFRPLDEAENDVITRAREAFAAIPTIPCTSCAYCVKGCPAGIPIPGVFKLVNQHKLYQNTADIKKRYARLTGKDDAAPASACIGCGQCEEVCPQHIEIRKELAEAAEILE